MFLHLFDLVDPDVVDAYLFDHLADAITDDAKAEARAIAEDALSLTEPPAGAHVLLARLAELAGDATAFAEHTQLALRADPSFGPALADQDYLDFLQAGSGSRAGPARRAELLFHKADRWSGRVPQLTDQFALASRVLDMEDARDHPAAYALASQWQFLGFLLFEVGLLERFETDCGPLLPAAERAILSSWHGVRHRLVRLEGQRGRRGSFTDLVTGELLDVTVLRDEGTWAPGRTGLALLVPAGDRLALVGEPVLVDDELSAVFQRALGAVDPVLVAEICLKQCFVVRLEQVVAEQDRRLKFVLPDADPSELDFSEEGVLQHLRRTRPVLAARADAGDVDAEARLVLDAIVAHRIITLRVAHTWALAECLLAEGHGREAVLARLRAATAAELLERARTVA